ncbi:MAG: NAD-dependent epimerase [Candidatus Levybacteria bacterium RIFCSPHIGHO2_12_FULL_38_12]|nr:MAG: NAD-dependent epimerase [Candidatus Levybacteria bacterium RIFCSPHIGHO2_01_FULL_38_12]OGH21759.1 MAG: NAD-dependent epimerase [Candidatus Levybacteria bacterium RIFCSPHIGHO2_02_FULL_37_18]OGH22583.1 MAG: NAD-dependent epimerase [Candidatus Levybacteria bacterium RIFCSPHIGHO2_12_FULL_38_12]OGH33380.1 MAG: NAD-dependent epimerase [Candidatus Levybacteria bacterium RIFCSPLOWO2_01_FULL_37_20]OGH44121.1 MAG: NAD-dependent epimerase [Candidatus Levybacteria bacterium RIFCSPLOWO2_02_FULL_37_18
MKKALITGSAGLIGSESVRFFCEKDFQVFGIDNDMRSYFFGKEASTLWNKEKLEKYKNYTHYAFDIRDEKELDKMFKKNTFDLIIHTAAQPSHDWAAKEPLTDFSINATATLLLLENFRKYSSEGVFIFTSTNKVYGDRPNFLPLIETEKRYELSEDHTFYQGVDESMSIDDCLHSIFGASKVAADIMVAEYGKYFHLKTAIFRGGCLTGPAHSGTSLHGFLAYLVRCIATGKKYTILGFKGKQVRDNIHSSDLIRAFYEVYKNPRHGEAYNIGGSRYSNFSILEAIEQIELILKKKAKVEYVDKNRIGDHMWYISDISKFRSHYPNWEFKISPQEILEDLCKHGHIE